MNNILFAFLLTLFAGLSTGIGSFIALLVKKENKKFLSVSLGFSAGVMIYVSMVEMFVNAKVSLVEQLGDFQGYLWTILSFFIGILIILLIDKVVPSNKKDDEKNANILNEKQSFKNKKQLYRTGIFTALVLAIHNLPEGLATFASSIYEPSLGIAIAIAIAIHNIPEGIAVSVPIYYATGNRKKAFFYSFVSGLAEPVGAIIGYLILGTILNELAFGIIFGMLSGIMVYISIAELLPSAREYGDNQLVIYGTVIGMFVMAISLLLL